MWNGTMFVDLDWPLNASSLLSASVELLVHIWRAWFRQWSGNTKNSPLASFYGSQG